MKRQYLMFRNINDIYTLSDINNDDIGAVELFDNILVDLERMEIYKSQDHKWHKIEHLD